MSAVRHITGVVGLDHFRMLQPECGVSQKIYSEVNLDEIWVADQRGAPWHKRFADEEDTG
jgi:hypothetical protein